MKSKFRGTYMAVVYKTNPNYSAQTISGVTVIIPVSQDCPKFNGMMKLTGIGPFLWDVFKNGATFEDACLRVINDYEVSSETVYKDVRAFITSLMENGLLIEIGV